MRVYITQSLTKSGGAKGGRTPDLFHAMEALSQLSYSPTAKLLERETGIEPASLAWEAKILPLNHSRPAYMPIVTGVAFPSRLSAQGSQSFKFIPVELFGAMSVCPYCTTTFVHSRVHPSSSHMCTGFIHSPFQNLVALDGDDPSSYR